MILDNENTDFPTDSEVLKRMGESEYKFYLTGSRFMRHGQRPDSDWDFMVQDSKEVREFLESIGFPAWNVLSYIGGNGNGRSLTTAVWQICEEETTAADLCFPDYRTFQVQFCPDVTRKLFVRDTIAKQSLAEFHVDIRNADRNELWELIGRQFPVEL